MSNHTVSNVTSQTTPEYFKLCDMFHVVKALDRNQKIHTDVLDAIGNTPLVKLNNIPKREGIECDMYAKCEFLNPGGSVKDRIAYRMILDAEKKGILTPGESVLIEPTSGNTGIGLALATAIKGYRCIIVLPEKMSDEKVNTLLALGAEVIRTPTEAAWDSPESNIMVARRLAKEIPNAHILDQYNNVCNPLAHYDGTAEEILWSLDDNLDMVVIGAGTSGTVSGVGHKIKERCPKCLIVAVDPYGSILAEPEELNKSDVKTYEVEGIGYDFLPKVLDRRAVDKWIKTDDIKSLEMARRLIKEEGLLCGGSSGSAMCGALEVARSLKKGQKCVVILPDSVRNYMTKFISDQWMEARGFKAVPSNDKLWWWDKPLSSDHFSPISTLSHSSTMSDALTALHTSQSIALPVLDDEGIIVGMFTADNARRRITNLLASPSDAVTNLLVKKFNKVVFNDTPAPNLGLVSRMLDVAPYVLVVEKCGIGTSVCVEKPLGVISAQDLLQIISLNMPTNGMSS